LYEFLRAAKWGDKLAQKSCGFIYSQSIKTNVFFLLFAVNVTIHLLFLTRSLDSFIVVSFFSVLYFGLAISSILWFSICSSVAQSDKASDLDGAGQQVRFASKLFSFTALFLIEICLIAILIFTFFYF